VKKRGQRLELLFISAQKTATLACKLCINGGEKDPTPFVKVAEDQEVYNFGIQMFVHYSSNFWRKTQSKCASLSCFGSSRSRARRLRRRRASAAPPLGPHAEAGLCPLVRAPWDPLHRTAIPAPSPCPTCRARIGHAAPTVDARPMVSPPYAAACCCLSVPRPRCPLLCACSPLAI
jgi:hypothetical protein